MKTRKTKSRNLSVRGVAKMAGLMGLAGISHTTTANVNIPSDMPVSPLFGAQSFAQQMLRFEEFDVRPLPAPGAAQTKPFVAPGTCDGRPNASAMEELLEAPLWPDPTVAANTSLTNPWAEMIGTCLFTTITGPAEGRPPGISFAHQRWSEFSPQLYFQSAQGAARVNNGRLDDTQSHGYVSGEFAVGGLYHNTTGMGGSEGTTKGIEIKFHPSMPLQNPNTLWTFGDGTLPPKLLMARYGLPLLFRHYNALPIDAAANGGFGEHTLTTHEHNGHHPGESDGFAGAYFFPGQFYDYRWPMVLAGYDTINADARDPRASTPCSPGEVLMIPDPNAGTPVAKPCDPVTHTVKIPGDWRETMSTHWFHDHMIDRTSENVYKGNAAMMNYYSGIDRGKEGFLCDYADTPTQDNINLCFPSGTALDWGNRDYDVQLLIAAKAWTPGTGQLAMARGLNEDGFLGDRMTVNWLYEPYFEVRPRRYRFRVLNAAVARFFKFAIVEQIGGTGGALAGPPGSNVSYNRVNYHMVANDGNIMEHAIPFGPDNPNGVDPDLPVQAIAERYDIIIDFSDYEVGRKLFMVNTLAHVDGRGPKEVIPLANILNGQFAPEPRLANCNDTCWSEDPTVKRFLEFRVAADTGAPDLSMDPNLYVATEFGGGGKTMIPLVQFTQAELDGAIHRTFDFTRGANPGQATDNRQTPWGIVTDDELETDDCLDFPLDPGLCSRNADVNRVSAAPETIGGGVEIWHIRNGGGGWGHPVHIHFEEGQYLDRDGAIPPPWEVGARKDMYRVSGLNSTSSSSNISVAIRFREFAGTYVEHCHNTTHEDKAMLLRWDNEMPGQTVRIPTPLPTWNGVGYVSATNPSHRGDTAVIEQATIKTGNVAVAATSDLDGDGILDSLDNCVIVPNPGQEDVLDVGGPDGIGDACDNCQLLANADQRDTNADGFGNACDADLNGDGQVNLADFSEFRASFGTNRKDADLNGDGTVNLSDFSLFRSRFGGVPGPSASSP
jgi:FtsP/CotA-like multicopper oxidase with cupredoxin domain